MALVAVIFTAAGSTAQNQDYDFEVDGLYLKLKSTTTDTIETTLVGMTIAQQGADMTLSPVVEYSNTPIKIVEITLELDLPTEVGNTLTIPGGIQINTLKSAPFVSFNLPKDVSLMDLIQGNGYIQSIILPADITAIPDGAFKGCRSLKNITLPPSVTEIGNHAFEDCSSMTSVKGLENIATVGDVAFAGCSSLDSVYFTPVLTDLGAYAFEGCEALKEISIGSVTTIKSHTFSQSGITSIDFLNDITTIEPYGLVGLTLEVANLPDKVSSLRRGAIGGNIKRVRLGDSMKIVGKNAFTGQGGFRSHSGEWSWYVCFSGYFKGLEDIDINKAEVVHLGAFNHFDNLKALTFSPTVTTIYCDCPEPYDYCYFSGFTGSVIIQDSPQPLLLHGSSGSYFMDEVYIGRSLIGDTYTDYDAPFFMVSNLTLGDLVEHLPGKTFYRCDPLEIALPKNLRFIGNNCFKGITNAELILPAKLDTIESKAFGDMPNLKKVVSLAKVPPVCDPDVFTSMQYAFATLEVPDVEAYRAAPGWKNFRNIVTSGIDDPLADPSAPVISLEEGAIKVSGSGDAEIYTSDGRLVYRGSPATIPALPRGLYIVRAGSSALKLTL